MEDWLREIPLSPPKKCSLALTQRLVQYRDVTQWGQSLARKCLLGPGERKCVIWVATKWGDLSFYCLDQEQILEASLRKEPALCIVQRRETVGLWWHYCLEPEQTLDFHIAKASFSLFEKPFELRFCYLKLKHFKWMQKMGGPKHVPIIHNGSFKLVDALLTPHGDYFHFVVSSKVFTHSFH